MGFQRHLHKMTRRFLSISVIILSLLVISVVWFVFSTQNQTPIQTYPATINRDCAPWDGSAFTVSIPYDSISTVTISIWQSPEIRVPVTFSFPDETGRVGFAYTLPSLDPLEQLSGKVTFWRVDEEGPVEGQFDLITDTGEHFNGKFIAEWGDEIIYCG